MTAGELLRQTREKRNLALEDVEDATRIRKKYLEAMEDNSIESIIDQAYAACFLRTYARFLELDAGELFKEVANHRETEGQPTEVTTSGKKQIWLNRLFERLFNYPGAATR